MVVNDWQCDQDGKFQPPQRKVNVPAAKKVVQSFLTLCGYAKSWNWTTVA